MKKFNDNNKGKLGDLWKLPNEELKNEGKKREQPTWWVTNPSTRILSIFQETPDHSDTNHYINTKNDENNHISWIRVDYISPVGSDETHYEKCHFNPEVVNFEDGINLILNGEGKSEGWTIRIYKNYDGKQHYWCIATIEYNNWTITSEKGYVAKDQKVKLIRRYGWRWSMDYDLCLAE